MKDFLQGRSSEFLSYLMQGEVFILFFQNTDMTFMGQGGMFSISFFSSEFPLREGGGNQGLLEDFRNPLHVIKNAQESDAVS